MIGNRRLRRERPRPAGRRRRCGHPARNEDEGPAAAQRPPANCRSSVVDCENIPIFAPLIHRYMLYGKLIKPLLFSLPPEQAHHIVTATLSLLGKVPGGRWLLHKLYATEDPSLEREVFGIRFKNPVGMAAGFDRYGHIYRELSAMGFGFVEVGSITPKRQPGNPKPRIFRLDAARALLNRVGHLQPRSRPRRGAPATAARRGDRRLQHRQEHGHALRPGAGRLPQMLPQPLPVRRLFHDQRRLRSGAEGSIVPDARKHHEDSGTALRIPPRAEPVPPHPAESLARPLGRDDRPDDRHHARHAARTAW